MTEQFPFVVIRPEETSQSLRSEKPLLWKAIMVAAAHENSDRQLSLGANLMEDITTRLLFRAEKSLHLLQALLVFIAWYALAALRLVSPNYVFRTTSIKSTTGTTITLWPIHRQ